MSQLKTYAVEIWVTDCYLADGITAASKEDAERIALDLWEHHELEPVEAMQEVSSTYVEEVSR